MEGINAVYIDKVEAPHNSVRMVSMVGKTIPLYCSGVGKAILADMDDDQIRQIWEQSELHTYTANTVTDYNTFFRGSSLQFVTTDILWIMRRWKSESGALLYPLAVYTTNCHMLSASLLQRTA